MPLDLGRVTHLLEQMHRSEDDAGDPIVAGKTLVTDGAAGFTWEDPGATSLDDLTDVTLTSPATADRLRFDGSVWRNSALVWTPMTVFDPTTGNYLPLVDGSGNAVMTEV